MNAGVRRSSITFGGRDGRNFRVLGAVVGALFGGSLGLLSAGNFLTGVSLSALPLAPWVSIALLSVGLATLGWKIGSLQDDDGPRASDRDDDDRTVSVRVSEPNAQHIRQMMKPDPSKDVTPSL